MQIQPPLTTFPSGTNVFFLCIFSHTCHITRSLESYVFWIFLINNFYLCGVLAILPICVSITPFISLRLTSVFHQTDKSSVFPIQVVYWNSLLLQTHFTHCLPVTDINLVYKNVCSPYAKCLARSLPAQRDVQKTWVFTRQIFIIITFGLVGHSVYPEQNIKSEMLPFDV